MMNSKDKNVHNSTDNIQDEDFFSQYLQGESPLSELYQKTEQAKPSEQLNQLILAEAQNARQKPTNARSGHWWTHPGSLAASIFIVSLAGVLTHNIWQTEQEALPNTSTDTPATEESTRSRQVIYSEQKQDSRKLIFKSAPAPIRQTTPDYFRQDNAGSAIKSSLHKEMKTLPTNDMLPQTTAAFYKELTLKKESLSPADKWLQKITHLLETQRLDEAQYEMKQFRKKYPNYPVSSVIQQALSP